MKLYSRLFITAICIQLCISCSKSIATADGDNSKGDNAVHGLQALPGVWELRSLLGGTTAGIAGDYEPGNGNLHKFTDDKYWFVYNANDIDSGSYALSSGINPETNTTMDAMIFNQDSLLPRYFTITSDTLTIYTGVVFADGTIEKFVRIANPE